jgi:hypothetical protein
MPISYSVNGEILSLTDIGHASAGEALQILEKALNDPLFSPGMNVLVNLTQFKGTETDEKIKYIARFLGTHYEHLGPRCAIVVSDPLHYGLSRIISAYTQFYQLTFEVFSDLSQAKQWVESKE